ncbi:putative endoIII-related endonuclease [Sphaerochaeta pleomorpha str. Grapes]|uniref:Putative endoIII-related endonuclease n=1 Tax=Sphaerochaeta pleomorpha (strain ATCC BAA-1885 / DSM 22778 / Grapes) TaxID=158190 RepID=G8QYQ0_SPHPG|nr:endonuclease III [Sphaerochaeta pleomorpha]AEV29677.1 putative endoIII-related endonuclease [Sphaerochaeta pleomorpha str. Grapes]
MEDQYWVDLFSRFGSTIKKEGGKLPSVSAIALEKQDPFRVLVSTLISLRTKDEVTLQASRKLFSLADTPHAMLLLGQKAIEEAIYPAGFYKTKAKNLLAISEILEMTYNGKVPSSSEKLLQLPGVGIKTANLTLNLGFGIEAICVDCHVHQIANRMGWVATKTPEQTEQALQTVMPKRFWIPLNELLVVYGQYICTSVSPWCSKCSETATCLKNGVKKER